VTPYSRHLRTPTLEGAIAELEEALRLEPTLLAIGDAAAAKPRSPGKWSRKEVLGHLLDSAANNHQRFVRAQIPAHLQDGALHLDGYAQDEWVRLQAYAERPWRELVGLWAALNRHVLELLRRVARARLETPCHIGSDDPLPLGHVMIDYAGHVKHHLAQILEPASPR
jgi:hypothetical protein